MLKTYAANPYKTGITNSHSRSAVEIEQRNREYQRKKAAMERQEYFDRVREPAYEALKKEELERKERIVPRVVAEISKEGYRRIPEIVLRDYFTNLVCEALGPSKEDPKHTIFDQQELDMSRLGIRFMCHAYIRDLGGLSYVKEMAEKTGSDYLNKVYTTCMEAGKKIAAKKADQVAKETTPENVEDVRLDLSVDTQDEELVNKSMNDLQIGDIADLVKDKVLQVVKDEETAQKKDEQFIAEMKESIKQDAEAEKQLPMTINNGDGPATDAGGTDAGASTGGEAATDAATGGMEPKEEPEEDTDKSPNKEGDKLSKDTQKKAEDASNAAQKDAKKTMDKATQTTAESLSFQRKMALMNRDSLQSSLFRSITMRCYATAVKENLGTPITESGEVKHREFMSSSPTSSFDDVNIYDSFMQGKTDDIDYIDFARNTQKPAIASSNYSRIDRTEVLAEALVFYTALECAFSIKLIDPSARQLKKQIADNIAACK